MSEIEELIHFLEHIKNNLQSREEKPPKSLILLIIYCKDTINTNDFDIDYFDKYFNDCINDFITLIGGGYVYFKTGSQKDLFFKKLEQLRIRIYLAVFKKFGFQSELCPLITSYLIKDKNRIKKLLKAANPFENIIFGKTLPVLESNHVITYDNLDQLVTGIVQLKTTNIGKRDQTPTYALFEWFKVLKDIGLLSQFPWQHLITLKRNLDPNRSFIPHSLMMGLLPRVGSSEYILGTFTRYVLPEMHNYHLFPPKNWIEWHEKVKLLNKLGGPHNHIFYQFFIPSLIRSSLINNENFTETILGIKKLKKQLSQNTLDRIYRNIIPIIEETGYLKNTSFKNITDGLIIAYSSLTNIKRPSIFRAWFENNHIDIDIYPNLIKAGAKLSKPWHEVCLFCSEVKTRYVEQLNSKQLSPYLTNFTRISPLPQDVYYHCMENHDCEGLLQMINKSIGSFDDDHRFDTVEKIVKYGYLCCHITNTWGNKYSMLLPIFKDNSFKNIINCLHNQGKINFPLSCSSIKPGNINGLCITNGFGIKGGIGIILDSGFIREAHVDDGMVKKKEFKLKYNSSKGERKISFVRSTGWSETRVPIRVALELANSPYNELVVERWTIGGFFYTRHFGVDVGEYVKKKLFALADEFSGRMLNKPGEIIGVTEWINNPAWMNRSSNYGIAKQIPKTYPVYEVDTTTNTWRIVYTPNGKL